MRSAPVRIGFIGAGAIARDRHVPGFRRTPGVSLHGVVNRTAESSRRAAAAFGFERTYRTWQQLIGDPEIDAVVIGTWPYLHARATLAALDAGKHVLCQARMAMNAAEARAMLQAAVEHPEQVAMLVPSPFSIWADLTIRRVIESGALGRLLFVRAIWGDARPGDALHWRQRRRYSGNNIMSLGIVYEAVMRWLGPASAVTAVTRLFEPDRVGGTADVPDHVNLVAELPAGVLLQLEVSTRTGSDPLREIVLYGDRGSLRGDFSRSRLELRSDGNEAPVVPRPDERRDWEVEREFVGAIRGEREVRLNDFAVGVRYMELTDAVHRSARLGRRGAVPGA